MSKNSRPQARDPYNSDDRSSPAVWGWETVEPEYQDVGANDEGYFYQWCAVCARRTEHDSQCCISCENSF